MFENMLLFVLEISEYMIKERTRNSKEICEREVHFIFSERKWEDRTNLWFPNFINSINKYRLSIYLAGTVVCK